MISILKKWFSPAKQAKARRPQIDAAVSVRTGSGVVLQDGQVVMLIPPEGVLTLHEAAVERGRLVARQKAKKSTPTKPARVVKSTPPAETEFSHEFRTQPAPL
jgi:hypothetical protein